MLKTKPSRAAKSTAGPSKPSRDGLVYLLSPAKDRAEHKRIVKSYRGKFAWVGYGADDYLKDKQKEIEAENR